jgi:photosystem II stability/assembly factor-like uncharacterized protein
MKRIFTLLALLVLTINVCGQISFEGAARYGRLYNITFDPTTENKLYALTIGNHLMTSGDKGESWEILYSFPNSTVMLQDLKYREDHTLTFIVDGTADVDGVYIFDLQTESIMQQYIAPTPADSYRDWISSYSIYPADTNIAVLHQSYIDAGFNAFAKVYYTTDGGSSWQEVYFNVNYGGVFPNNVAIAPNNPQKLYMARGAGPNFGQGGFLISENAGTTWNETMAGTTFKAITFHPNDPNIMWLGTFIGTESQTEQLLKSTDGGQTWLPNAITWTDETLDCINAIVYNPLNLDNIMVLEENEISITLDGGTSWTNYVYPVTNPESYTFGIHASFNPFVDNEVFINPDYYPLFSQDGGVTLDLLPVEFHRTSMVGLAPNSNSHVYYSVQEGIVHRDVTTGETTHSYITPIDIFSINNPTRYYVDPITLGRIYSFTDSFSGASLEVSNDHGQTRNLIYQTFFDDVRALTPNPANPNLIWVSMREAGLISFDFSDFNQVIETPIQSPETGIVYEIYFNPTNSDEVWIAINNTIYKSLDNGGNWEAKGNGLSLSMDEAVFDIVQNPNNTDQFLAASSNGIYKTSDGGAEWTQVLSVNNVRKIDYSPLAEGSIVASIYSSDVAEAQLIYSTDNGENWNLVPLEAMVHVQSSSMDYFFNENSADVYVATNDIGIVKFNIELSTLGSPDNTSSNSIVVYPNPTKDILYIKGEQTNFNEIAIYNSSGVLIAHYPANNNISLAGLSTGVYFLKVVVNDEIYIKRIIKE